MNIFIVDDEPLARDELHRLLAAHPAARVVGEAAKIADARTLLARGGYDVVFLDIQLAGGSGFDLVSSVTPDAAIIFVTAHDQFAVRAFEVNALDYLLKPVSPARLAAALGRLAQPSFPPAAALVVGDRVYLKSERLARFVPLNDLSAIVANDNYTDVFVADGAHFLMRRPMKAWELILPAAQFLRVHRGAIVNLAQIDRIDEPDSETPVLHVRGARAPITCSHRLSPELRRRLT